MLVKLVRCAWIYRPTKLCENYVSQYIMTIIVNIYRMMKEDMNYV